MGLNNTRDWRTGMRAAVGALIASTVILLAATTPATAEEVTPEPIPTLSPADEESLTVSEPVPAPPAGSQEEAVGETPEDSPASAESTQVPSGVVGQEETDSPAPAPADSMVAPFSVPAPGDDSSVITVKTGGLRTSSTDVAGLAGVTLRLFNGDADGPVGPALTDAWAVCVSDADGDCSFTIPQTQPRGENRDRRFWIVQDAPAPSGYFLNSRLATGANPTSNAYRFRTGNQLRQAVSYTSESDFMIASGTASNASSGIWQSSLINPPYPQQCGLDVALILDLSGSVSPYVSNLRAAASTFVDSLTGTPSQVSLFTFADRAPAATGANLGLTPVSTAAGATLVKNRIATYTAGGSTNWDRGIYQVANAPTTFDVAVVITDGNPTVYGAAEGPGNRTRFREVENGIFSANTLKNQGTRVIAVGVGDGVGGAADNLRAISGPTLGVDYYQTDDYAAAGAALRELALGSCEGSISIVKQVVNANTTDEDITGAAPAGGWEFRATTTTNGTTPTSQTAVTAAGTGAVNFPLTFAGGTESATMTIAETQQPGFSLVTRDLDRAVCVDIASGDALAVTNDAADQNAFSVDVPRSAAVSCVVYNRPPAPQASVTVTKRWIVNGVTYEDGNQPLGINAALVVDGTSQIWGIPRSGLLAGTPVVIDETTSIVGRDLCVLTGSRLTQANGVDVDLVVPQSMALEAGENSYELTNTVECEAMLTLDKRVAGGSADPAEWNLSAVAPADALPGPNGSAGTPAATAPVTPGVRYPLIEEGGSPLYVQRILSGGAPIPPSTGSWECRQVDATGTVIPGFNDGINGGVTVPLGTRVRCTAVNETATLTMIKSVTNDDGGTAAPEDWELTAAPAEGADPDLEPISVGGSSDGRTITIRPGTTYRLTEEGPDGYTQQSLQCDTGPDGEYIDATTITLDALEEATCVFVNNDLPATLTLEKTVDTADTGSPLTAADWMLSAAGPTSIVGTTGSAAVTAVPVDAGTYVLSETGPAGYRTTGWACRGEELVDDEITLSGGDDVTCSIVNTAQTVDLTVFKIHEPLVRDAAAPGDAISYRITVENRSEGSAHDVVLTDVLPAELSLNEGSLGVPDGWTVNTQGASITLTFAGAFNPGDTADFSYRTTVGALTNAGLASESAIINVACVAMTETDADSADNCATDTTPVRDAVSPPPPNPPSGGGVAGPLPGTGGGTPWALVWGGLIAVVTGLAALVVTRRGRSARSRGTPSLDF